MPEDFAHSIPASKTSAQRAVTEVIYAPARAARIKRRHRLLLYSFLIFVLFPIVMTGLYLWTRAADQFTSFVGFTVQQEDDPAVTDIFGGLPNLQTVSPDSDILFAFIRSPDMVQRVNAQVNLRAVFSRHSDVDPVFALNPDSSLEDLVAYWRRVVQVFHTPSAGMIDLHVHAFEPKEAQLIAQAIVNESTKRINQLSGQARKDALRFAQSDVEAAKTKLTQTRQALRAFQARSQIVDPEADIEMRMGLLTTLQQRLTDSVITHDLLRESTQPTDPRLAQSERRISVIQNRIQQERAKLGAKTKLGEELDFTSVLADFEHLTVEREFAEQRYIAALANLDMAQSKAQRQNRYLATYLEPTLAETAEHPRRALILGLTMLFLLISWAILALIYYSLRDRR